MIINDYNINYIDTGEIKNSPFDILFIHGWGADLNLFNNGINLLKNKYRVFALDLPGFGKSDDLKRSFNIDDYCGIVIKFIENLNIKNICLIGHSYGGRIIIKLNNRNDLNFNIVKNVLIDAAGIKHKLSLIKRIKVKIYKLAKFFINIIPNKKLKNDLLDNLRSKFGSTDYKNAKPLLRETLVKSVNEDLSEQIKNISKETLLIWGDKDKDTPIEDAKYMEKNIKNSGLVVLNNTGHFSFLEDSNTYLRVLASFFEI